MLKEFVVHTTYDGILIDNVSKELQNITFEYFSMSDLNMSISFLMGDIGDELSGLNRSNT